MPIWCASHRLATELFVLVPVGVTLTACSGARCEQPAAAPAKVTQLAPPVAVEPIPTVLPVAAQLQSVTGQVGELLITDPRARQLFEEWRNRRVSYFSTQGKAASYSIVEQSSSANYLFLLVTERLISGTECVDRRVSLQESSLHILPYHPVKLSDALLGYDCCPGTPCKRTPLSWMLHLDDILRSRDEQAMAVLMEQGLEVEVSYKLENDHSTSYKESLSRLDASFPAIDPFFAPHSGGGISCPDDFDAKGEAVCHAGGTTKPGRYFWKKMGDKVQLVKVEEKSL